jgi:hypothetical protein
MGVDFLFPPVEGKLQIPRGGHSAAFLKKVSASNIAGSFEKGAKLLGMLSGIKITAKQVQRLSEKVGQVLVDEREARRQGFLRGEPPPSPPNPPHLLVISADGGRVQTRHKDRDKKWKEDKIGAVYRAEPCPEKPGQPYQGPKPLVKTYVATMADWDTMGDYLSLEAAQRGYEEARQKVFIGDAAQGVKSLWQRCFCNAEFINDWPHAAEHLHACALAAFGNTPRAQEWYEHQKQSLWDGKVHLVIRAVAKESKRLGSPRNNGPENDPRLTLSRNLGYFSENQSHMNYPRYRQNGWPIGSGIVESGVKQFGQRVKGSEKHWSVPGVESILVLMSLLMAEDNRWTKFWISHPLASHPKRQAA